MDLMQRQVKVTQTLDVEAVERVLTDLWKSTAAESGTEEALLRARASNLMVFLADESRLPETHQVIAELSRVHPCRALVLAGDQKAIDRDIEIYVSAFCPTRKRAESRNLCCEEVTLVAGGEFVSELPSAAIPLLLPDLEVFLWWRNTLRADEQVLRELLAVADRLVIDSANFEDSLAELGALNRILEGREPEEILVSDINWERLTPWRASLANFYDVPNYRAALDDVNLVRIEYAGQEQSLGSSLKMPAQPLLVAGWLASRLNWRLRKRTEDLPGPPTLLQFVRESRGIAVELNPVVVPAVNPGRVVRIELKSLGIEPATFIVGRSDDGLYLESLAQIGLQPCPARRVPFESRSTAELLSREMEILCVDRVYVEAIKLPNDMGSSAYGQ